MPSPVFPVALDNDYTLFLTHESTQSLLAEDLNADATEIAIIPVTANDPEVWPDNGFITIENELIYYDASEKNNDDKICRLIRCLRKLEGKLSEGQAGTPVYGMVVAQHHNQLADAIINIERTLGDIAILEGKIPVGVQKMRGTHTDGTMSLHRSMMSLMGAAPAADDICPDVSFTFTTLTSTLAEYCVRIQGDFDTYQLDFGDGTSTNDTFEGTHTYSFPPSATPSVTVTNDGCTIVLTPETSQPGYNVADISPPAVSFAVPIPDAPNFPLFITPKQICPGPILQLPPIAQPCVQLSTSCCPISFGNLISDIRVSCIGCCLPSSISVIWGVPPVVSCIVEIKCPTYSTSCTSNNWTANNNWTPPGFAANLPESGEDGFQDGFDMEDIPVTMEELGIPREINLRHNLHEGVRLIGEVPDTITIIATDIPKSIPIDASSLLTTRILVEPAPNFPKVLKVDMPDTLKVTGFPTSIPLIFSQEYIQLRMPENPVVDMRYTGGPIDVRVELDPRKLIEAGMAIVQVNK